MSIRMVQFHLFAGIVIAGFGGCSFPDRMERESSAPNLIFVFADQYRRQAMGFMDKDPVKTPHFNRFAKEAQYFTNAVSPVPTCSPFRAMLMTGRYPTSTGITTNLLAGVDHQLDTAEVTNAALLRAANYQTAHIGKWHLDIPERNQIGSPRTQKVKGRKTSIFSVKWSVNW